MTKWNKSVKLTISVVRISLIKLLMIFFLISENINFQKFIYKVGPVMEKVIEENSDLHLINKKNEA